MCLIDSRHPLNSDHTFQFYFFPLPYFLFCYSFHTFTSIKVTASPSHTFSDLYFCVAFFFLNLFRGITKISSGSWLLFPRVFSKVWSIFSFPTNLKITENPLITRILIISNMPLVFDPTESLISVPWLNNSSQPPCGKSSPQFSPHPRHCQQHPLRASTTSFKLTLKLLLKLVHIFKKYLRQQGELAFLSLSCFCSSFHANSASRTIASLKSRICRTQARLSRDLRGQRSSSRRPLVASRRAFPSTRPEAGATGSTAAFLLD